MPNQLGACVLRFDRCAVADKSTELQKRTGELPGLLRTYRTERGPRWSTVISNPIKSSLQARHTVCPSNEPS